MSKFDCARDEALSMMASDGWANESDGNVESPTGWFARVSNDPADIQEIGQAFSEEFATLEGFDLSSLVGHFLIEESELGFVYVTIYENERDLIEQFDAMQQIHTEWENN